MTPGRLIGEVTQNAGTHVVVCGGVGAVQAGDPVLAGRSAVAQVEAVPGDSLGKGYGQGVQARTDGGRVAAVFEEEERVPELLELAAA
ncbi:hypothetical protein [Streptomyces sp. NPDC002769]|uniref:hypothetical protein n=1 Tax=Streptomyces sp. NPDC002769 TaxID=3154542 RepID=UPI00332180B3